MDSTTFAGSAENTDSAPPEAETTSTVESPAEEERELTEVDPAPTSGGRAVHWDGRAFVWS